MPQKRDNAVVTSGQQEQARVMLLSELIEELIEAGAIDNDGKLIEGDMIIVGLPDTGLGEFKGSHPWKNDETKDTKAVFLVSTIGSDRAGFPIPYMQSQGDVAGLPLSVKLSVIATVPNQAGKTVDEALNRKVELKAVETGVETEVKTGTDG